MYPKFSMLAAGTAMLLIGLSQPAISQGQNQTCQEMRQDIRDAVEKANDLDRQKEQRIDDLLREARQALREQNNDECTQKITEARRILRQEGVQLAANTQESLPLNANEAEEKNRGEDVASRQRQADAGNNRQIQNTAQGRVVVEDAPPEVSVTQADPQVNVTQLAPEITVRQPQPEVIVRQPPPEVTVTQAAPEVTIKQLRPEIIVRIPQPIVTVKQPEADVNVRTPEPQVEVSDSQPNVRFIRQKPKIIIEDDEKAKVAVESGEANVNVNRAGKANENVRIEREKADVQYERTGMPKVNVKEADAKINVERTGEPDVKIEQEEAQINYERVEDKAQAEDKAQNDDRSAPAGAGVPVAKGDSGEPKTVASAKKTAEDKKQVASVQAENEPPTSGAQATAERAVQSSLKSHPLYDQPISSLVGKKVYSQRNEDIGEIEEIARKGNQLFAILGVGGFLGIGERNVAMPFDRITMKNNRITMPEFTRLELEQMPEYEASAYSTVPEDQRVSEAVLRR